MMATARDFDDTLDDAMLHTQPSVLYATLALGEARGRSEREALAALAAGTELQCRMGHARLRSQQFLPTGTTGGMAAAAAAARVIGLPAERLIDACGIAYSQCAANVQPLREGATVKRFHAGFAARTGTLSAVLAENGLTGAHRFLEGEFGYYQLYERGDYIPAPLTAGLGETWQLLAAFAETLSFGTRQSRRGRGGAESARATAACGRGHRAHRRLAAAERFRRVRASLGQPRRASGGRGDHQRVVRRRRCAHEGSPAAGRHDARRQAIPRCAISRARSVATRSPKAWTRSPSFRRRSK